LGRELRQYKLSGYYTLQSVAYCFAEMGYNPETLGKPEATVQPTLDVIDTQNKPKRLLFGKIAYLCCK